MSRPLFLCLLLAISLTLASRVKDEAFPPGLSPCSKSPAAGTNCSYDPIDFYPTQFMIGYDEAYQKQVIIESLNETGLLQYLVLNEMPVVVGPKNRLYITDHHHQCRAMFNARIPQKYKKLIANITFNWSNLDDKTFWQRMLSAGFYWPFDSNQNGPLDPMYLPKNIEEIPDDPYRTLVGNVILSGAIDKSTVPFAEFMWANFFRQNMDLMNYTAPACHPTEITPEKLMKMPWCCVRPADPSCFADPDHNGTDPYMAKATQLAHSSAAKKLPGYKPQKTL